MPERCLAEAPVPSDVHPNQKQYRYRLQTSHHGYQPNPSKICQKDGGQGEANEGKRQPEPLPGAFIGPADRANAHAKRSQGSKSHRGREEAREVSIQVGTQQTWNRERSHGEMKHQKGRCG